jgi:hypothetical protein
MKKKGMTLLITISFIAVISILILKNLDTSEKYVTNSNAEYANTQVFLLIKNFQNELFKAFENDTVYDAFTKNENQCTPMIFDFKNNISSLRICKYADKININSIFKKDDSFIEQSTSIFDQYNFNIYTFVSVVKRSDFKSIHSFKELDELFLLFKDELGYISDENDLILTLRNRFSFLDMNEESKILKIFLKINQENKIYNAHFLLDTANKKQRILGFEISYK